MKEGNLKCRGHLQSSAREVISLICKIKSRSDLGMRLLVTTLKILPPHKCSGYSHQVHPYIATKPSFSVCMCLLWFIHFNLYNSMYMACQYCACDQNHPNCVNLCLNLLTKVICNFCQRQIISKIFVHMQHHS